MNIELFNILERKDDMTLEQNIGNYVKSKGIQLTVMAKATGIVYSSLYDSILENSRPIRGTELLKVCKFLEKDPSFFYDEEDENEATEK